MAKDLVQKNGIASIPISVFYHSLLDQHLLRFCFAKKTETLKSFCLFTCAIYFYVVIGFV